MSKEVRISNTVREVTLIISWVCAVAFTIILFAAEATVPDALFTGITTGCFLHGLVHMELVFSKLNKFMSRLGLLLILIFGLVIVAPPYAIVFVIGCYSGAIFMVIDTILFILKKPLIYRFELKGYIGNILYKMTKTMNQGMMTVEDYEMRQAEMLSLL